MGYINMMAGWKVGRCDNELYYGTSRHAPVGKWGRSWKLRSADLM